MFFSLSFYHFHLNFGLLELLRCFPSRFSSANSERSCGRFSAPSRLGKSHSLALSFHPSHFPFCACFPAFLSPSGLRRAFLVQLTLPESKGVLEASHYTTQLLLSAPRTLPRCVGRTRESSCTVFMGNFSLFPSKLKSNSSLVGFQRLIGER